MKRILLLSLCFFCFLQTNAQSVWKKVSEAEASANGKKERNTIPKTAHYFQLDVAAFNQSVQTAPMRGQFSNTIVSFPDGNGNLQNFRIYQAPVMHKNLSARFPGNKSYVGVGTENPSSIIRFSVTLFGLHAMTLAADNGTSYIDPYSKDQNYYVSYLRKGLTTSRTFECFTAENKSAIEKSLAQPQDNGIYRTYRTGIVTTAEYSAFHIAEAGLESGTLEQKKAAVLAAVTVTITRVNAMFERDLSVFLQLIPNEDQIIFIDEDNLTNDDVGALINETQQTMDAVIGTENYDFGHGVGTSGGGLGGGQPCAEGAKAFGATGLGSPVGDPFDIDYVTHEMGHQFGAAHTFNNECGGNRDPNWSYEPGSGSSIMAYAGICDPNIQSNSNAQFFTGSIIQIKNTINGNGGNCVVKTQNNNHKPVVNAGSDYVIPKGTPFKLTGSATDPDGDALTYVWEQYDKEISVQPPSADATEGPNFKPQVITTIPVRYFPDLLQEDLTWEVISNVGRNYNFVFTIRDNNVNGGETAIGFMEVTSVQNAGPFLVTTPNTSVNWPVASNQIVTWDVAGTDGNGINVTNVDILLSTNGGLDYSIPLAVNVPNDGSESISVPNFPGNANRIMVRANGNIFYDVSNENFSITASGPTFLLENEGSQNTSICLGTNTNFVFNYTVIDGFDGTTSFTVSGLPENVQATLTPTTLDSNGIINLTINNTGTSLVGLYTITVAAVSNNGIKISTVYLNLLDADFENVTLTSPADNSIGISFSPTFTWSDNASQYTFQLATNPDFSDIVRTFIVSTPTTLLTDLEPATTYYWRVRPENVACFGNFSETSQFTTGQISCTDFSATDIPVLIPSDEAATVSSTLNITDNFSIQNATITLDITHSWLTDLVVKLISPSGTVIDLFTRQCGDADDAVATFSDEGNTLVCNGTPVLSGIIKPETPLSSLNGEMSSGEWRLEVQDEFGQDGGFINSWSLNLCQIVPALATNSFENVADFSIFPNPNKGTFSVTTKNLEGTFDLNVYDIRGRKIYQKQSVLNRGNTIEGVELQVQSGMYFIEIISQKARTVKKFIVN